MTVPNRDKRQSEARIGQRCQNQQSYPQTGTAAVQVIHTIHARTRGQVAQCHHRWRYRLC